MRNPPLEDTIEEHWGCQVHTWLAVLRKMDTPSPLPLFDLPELQTCVRVTSLPLTTNASISTEVGYAIKEPPSFPK